MKATPGNGGALIHFPYNIKENRDVRRTVMYQIVSNWHSESEPVGKSLTIQVEHLQRRLRVGLLAHQSETAEVGVGPESRVSLVGLLRRVVKRSHACRSTI